MSRSGIPSMYDEFDDNDNTEGNDDDMAALGSILSWDEAEENDNIGNKSSDDEITGDSNVRSDVSGMSVPFETVHFSSRNGNHGHNFLQTPSSTSFNQTANSVQQDTGTGVNFHPPMTSATPDVVQQLAQGSQKNSLLSSLPEPIAVVDQLNQPQRLGMHLDFSLEQQQFIAQNPQTVAQFIASTVLQQHANQPLQQQAVSMFQSLPVQQSIQQSQPPERKQQTLEVLPQPPLPYPSDPNALLQQLQMAQFQQQLQAAQAQQQSSAAQPNLQIQSALQQLQAQFAHAQGSVPQLKTKPTAQSSRQTSTEQANGQNIASQLATLVSSSVSKSSSQLKKPKLTDSDTMKKSVVKAPPKAKLATIGTDTSVVGTVSASDTEAEASRKAKSSRALSSPTNDDDMDFLHLSPSEKLKANRDRNREHARNTRLRKKAYLEKLKSTVDELCRERDTLVSERADAASLLVEMHNIRTEVLISFLALRTSNERRRKLWSSVLDESCFACVMPITPYRSFPASEVQVSKCLRTVMGIDGMIADTASLHVLFDSLVNRYLYPYEKIDFRYTLVTEEAVVAGNQMMARWAMTTTNAVQYGARMEVSKQGMLCCKFNSAHKIIGLELMFDVMAFMLQLKQASGADGFTVIPNTVQTCQRSFDKPMIVTLAESPYTIIQVNKLWENMTGYSADEAVGRTSCAVLQGADMDKTCLHRMMDEVRYKRAASAMLVNRHKSGEDFTNFLVVFPLSTDSRITYYLGLTLYNASGRPSSCGSIRADPVSHTCQPVLSAPESIPPSSTNVASVLQNQDGQAMQNSNMINSMLFPSLVSMSNTCQHGQHNSLVQLSAQSQYVRSGRVTSSLSNIGTSIENIQINSSSLKRSRENDPDRRI